MRRDPAGRRVSKVPVRNLYYLLSYALGAPPGDHRSVGTTTADTPLELLADMLCREAARLCRRGLEREYREEAAELAGVRGKLDVGRTALRMLEPRGRTACRYSVLSGDTAANRLLRHTLEWLACQRTLDKGRRRNAHDLALRFAGAARVSRTQALGATIHWHRNNRSYRFAVDLCRFICTRALPTDDDGAASFPAFDLDSRVLGLVFERFVRNFWRREQSYWTVRGNARLQWPAQGAPASVALVPTQETDVDLYDAHGRWIVECKCTATPLVGRWSSRHLSGKYINQLFAYLSNAAAAGARLHGGVLLYAAVDAPLAAEFQLHGHTIAVRSVDLSAPWDTIADQMRTLVTGLRTSVSPASVSVATL